MKKPMDFYCKFCDNFFYYQKIPNKKFKCGFCGMVYKGYERKKTKGIKS